MTTYGDQQRRKLAEQAIRRMTARQERIADALLRRLERLEQRIAFEQRHVRPADADRDGRGRQ